MKREQLQPYLNTIVCLELVNRERPVARLIDVTDEHVVLKDPYVYVTVPNQQMQMQVQAVSYGAPLHDVKSLTIGLEHIVVRLDVQAQMEQAYIRQTTGLVTETKPSIIVP